MNKPPFSFKCSGSAIVDVVLGAAIIVFVVLPLFSAVIEKYIVMNKAQIIRDAVDMTNISTYNAINAGNLGKSIITLDSVEVDSIYRTLLAENLNLNNDLSPKTGSIAEGPVNIDSLLIFTSGFPTVCPNNNEINRPSVHSYITIPVRPSLYRQVILNILGKQYVEFKVHVDSEIPVNN